MPVADMLDGGRTKGARGALARGDAAAALADFDAVLNADPGDAAAAAGRAAALRALGRPREAMMAALSVLGREPDHMEARLQMAGALADMGRDDEARPAFALLARARNAPAEAWVGLAGLLQRQGANAAAEACLRRAVATDPGNTKARQRLADMLQHAGFLGAACDLYQDILAIQPSSPAAAAGLGQTLVGLKRLEEAEDQLERALGQDHGNVVARLGRARLRLLEGDFTSAWEDLEWRWQVPGQSRPEPPGEPWDGGPLDGRHILLWAEQGLDDTIQLARFIPRVAAMGGKVVLAVPAPLVPLMRTLEGVAHVVASGEALPVRVEVNASLLDLPRLFGTSLSSVPADIPYLAAPAGKRPPIAVPPAAVMKIGLVWATGRQAWSVPFADLMPLLGLAHAAFFSLQLGPHGKDAAQMAHPSLITDLAPTIGDYGDMAGRIAEMDLVVTVDCAAAHIAGALGKPALVMLPYAADWRWLMDRETSPWYPGLTLLRQERPGDWLGVVTRVLTELDSRIADQQELRTTALRDASGPKAALRAMLSGHLRAGDAFVDVGAGAGTFSLDAAAHPSGDVRVLAIEAKRGDAEMLADTIAISGAEDMVEVVNMPVAGCAMPAVVSNIPRAGRTVFPLPDWVDARAQTVAVDTLLADRPHLSSRRLIVRIGTKTSEGDVLDGLWEQLITHRAAVVLFEHRKGAVAADMLSQAGYTLYRFPTELAGGPVRPFEGQPGPVLALASGVQAHATYGDITNVTSPAAMATARDEAVTLAAEGTRKMLAGEPGEAARLLTRALAADPDNVQANTNMGALLRRIGKADAAACAWNRALACGAGNGVRANLANVLREIGKLDQAEATFVQALEAEPNNASILVSFAMLERQRGRARESLALLERAETVHPGAVPKRELAVALLKSGNLARGMAEMAHRTIPDLPPVPEGVQEWHGERLDARTILVRDEGDSIDTIQLARYIHQVGKQGGLVSVECVPEAARLISTLHGVEEAIPRGATLPVTDFVVHLGDVPRMIGTINRTTPPRDVPYVSLPENLSPHVFTDTGRLNVGITWAGRDRDPAVPLSAMLPLAANPTVQLVSLQRGPRAADLTATGALAFVDDMGSQCEDLADVAAIIAGLDLVIATDCVEAHIAGAMGKPVWVLLPLGNDWRWVDARDDSVWYPTMRVFRQSTDGTWTRAVTRAAETLAAMAARRR